MWQKYWKESDAAKKLVFPNGEETVLPPQQAEARLRIGFNGSATADKPLIATMAAEHGILANILGASTRAFHEQAFGEMLIGVPLSQKQAALDYLYSVPGITVEEVPEDA